jgi:hypothetical protein
LEELDPDPARVPHRAARPDRVPRTGTRVVKADESAMLEE